MGFDGKNSGKSTIKLKSPKEFKIQQSVFAETLGSIPDLKEDFDMISNSKI